MTNEIKRPPPPAPFPPPPSRMCKHVWGVLVETEESKKLRRDYEMLRQDFIKK